MSDFMNQILGAIDRQVDERLNSFETAIPGTVLSVRGDGRVDVSPDIRKMVTNGVIDKFDAPIRGVPVMQIGFSGFAFDLELQKGDTVVLLFFSRESSMWKGRRWGKSDPRTPFGNDLNNCVAIPFVRPDSGAKVIVKIDSKGLVTFDCSQVKITGNLFVDGLIVGREDVVVGPAPAGPGVSVLEHIHPTPVGPSGPTSPTKPIPPEET